MSWLDEVTEGQSAFVRSGNGRLTPVKIDRLLKLAALAVWVLVLWL